MKTLTIELDETTARRLEIQARELSLSVPELVAEMTVLQPVDVADAVVADLDQQIAAIKAGEPTVSNAQVESWLRTWGTSDFKSWRDR